MNETLVHETNNIYPQLENAMEFRLNKIDNIKDLFIEEINEREKVSKRLKKILSIINYFDELLLLITRSPGAVSMCSFATIIGSYIWLASAMIGLKVL